MIDATFTVGNLIEIAVIGCGSIGAVVAVRNSVVNLGRDIMRMEADFSDMRIEIKKVGDVLVQMARTDVRLTNAEKDIREIKHGEGFVHQAINRQYP